MACSTASSRTRESAPPNDVPVLMVPKLNMEMSASGWPRYSAPQKASALSSMSVRLSLRAAAASGATSKRRPNKWATSRARVWGVTSASTRSTRGASVSTSTSSGTMRSPWWRSSELMSGMLMAETMTSEPGGQRLASRKRWKAVRTESVASAPGPPHSASTSAAAAARCASLAGSPRSSRSACGSSPQGKSM